MKKFLITAGYITTVIIVSIILFGCESSTLDDDDLDDTLVSEFTVFFKEDGLADNWITDIAVDYFRNGVWCATLNGISFYSIADSMWTTFGAEYDIPNMKVTSITIDYRFVKVWAGTRSGPASFSDSVWTTLADMDSLVHRYITVITIIDGTRWFGTIGGVSTFSSSKGWSSFTVSSGLSDDNVTAVTVSATGDIWIGTTNGISVFDGEKWSVYGTKVLPSTLVNAIYCGYNGIMWCGTSNGIAAFDGVLWTRYGTVDGVPSPGINDFVEDWNNTLWVATDSGVAHFDGEKWHELSLPEQVKDEVVTVLAVDEYTGALWLGTVNGLVRYVPEITE